MSAVSHEVHVRLDQRIRAHEDQTADQLAALDVFEQEWAEYYQVMRANFADFEEAGVELGEKEYFVQRSLDSRREIDSYVRRVVDEQAELLEHAAREIRASAEAELERLQREKAGA
jgi:hypothetical protein